MPGRDVSTLGADMVEKFRFDPLSFVRFIFPWGRGDLAGQDGPDLWQTEFLEEIGRQLLGGAATLRFAVASGHGVGKTALVAWLILWLMNTRPDLAGVITANTMNQLRDKTWAELARWHKRALNAHCFKWSATKFSLAEQDETWFVSALPWSKETTEAFAGLHAKHVLVIMDEASAIPDAIWEVVEGALTTGGLFFVFGNPTRNTGRFRECFGRFSHRWTTRQVDGRDAKMVNQNQIKEWLADYGEDSDFFRVRVRGVFPNIGDRQFISAALAEDAARRVVEPDLSQPLIAGVDVARFGEDQSAIVFRRGRDARSIPMKVYRGLDGVQLANRVIEQCNIHRPAAVFVDGGGVGASCVDHLRLNRLAGLREINFASAADKKLEYGGDYANKRAEMWDSLKAWLPYGAIQDDRELIDGLCGGEYGFDRLDRLILEKKEDMKRRGLASPDKADALALTFAQPVALARRQPKEPAYYDRD
jgi:hypothetical protein